MKWSGSESERRGEIFVFFFYLVYFGMTEEFFGSETDIIVDNAWSRSQRLTEIRSQHWTFYEIVLN